MNTVSKPGTSARFFRLAVILPVVWLVVAVLFATQLALFDSMPVSLALGFAAMDWLPWIIIAPIVLWLGKRFEFTASTWGRSLLVHVLSCVLLTLALEMEFHLVMSSGIIAPPHEFGQRGGWPRRMEETSKSLDMTTKPSLPSQPGRSEVFGGPAPRMDNPAGPDKNWERGLGGPQGPLGPGGPSGAGSFLRTPRARMSIPLYWVLVAVAHALTYHRRSLERERRALQAESSLAEARLAVLQAQLNPHFLFNTLNTLAQFVHEDPHASERMIEGLARLLRASLAASERRLISVREELALADCYLEIQANRFPDRLTIVRDIDPTTMDRVLPTLLIQPLLENAIIHGIAPHRTPGVLSLRMRAEGDTGLCIEIVDTGDGQGLAMHGQEMKPSREGVGLRNTRQRLASLYGAGAEFKLSFDQAGGACSRVLIRVAPSLTQT